MTPPSDNQPQDITACVICGGPLTHVPKLGEWIAHDRCRDTAQVHVQEAEARGVRIGERAATERIAAGLRRVSLVGDFDANGKHALTWAAWAVARPTFGEHLDSGTVER